MSVNDPLCLGYSDCTWDDVSFLRSKQSKFIDPANASFFDWLRSAGTNFTCFQNYYFSLSKERKIDNKIDLIRTIIYSFMEPFKSQFFYWTILLFILHKFNFKKPVMKIILAHFVLRSIGDILDKLGDLFTHYFVYQENYDRNGNVVGYQCNYSRPSTEQHPLKWFLTRQIGNTFWYTGEITADWYPLLRTRAVAKDEKSIWLVYISCAVFNITKIVLISSHYFLSPTELYKVNGDYAFYDLKKIDNFYFVYWVIQFCIIISSLIYDFMVFYVLKTNVFEVSQSEFGFLKKFRTVSEFRIIVSVIICWIGLPIVCVSIFMKFYFCIANHYMDLNFSFDELRKLIANVQYFMIFIDQILLLRSKDESSLGETNNLSSLDLNTGNVNNFIKPSIDSKLYYGNLFNMNKGANSMTNISNNSTSTGRTHLSHTHRNKGHEYTSLKNSSINVNINNNSSNNSNKNVKNNNSSNNNNNNNNLDYSFSSDTPINNTQNNNVSNNRNNNTTSNVPNSYQINGVIPNNISLNTRNNRSNNGGKIHPAKYSNRNKSISNYDDYEGVANEWNYLRR